MLSLTTSGTRSYGSVRHVGVWLTTRQRLEVPVLAGLPRRRNLFTKG
jgi:hypothetical protein